jgi:hypothetical protein
MPQGLDHEMIKNSILYAGQPEIEEMEVKTETLFGPGRLVISDTTDYQCQVAGDNSALVLGVADIPSDDKLTAYYVPSAGGALSKTFAAGDQIRVLRGDIVVKLVALSAQTIVVGTKVAPAAAGMVKAGATAGQCIGYCVELNADISTCCDWILVKLTI